MGYAGANVTIEFLVRLTNEFSGKWSSCQLALNASLNETKDLSGDLEACQNSSKASTSVLDRQQKNFTDHGRLLDQCRKDLEAARKDVENVTQAHNGETAYLFFKLTFMIPLFFFDYFHFWMKKFAYCFG